MANKDNIKNKKQSESKNKLKSEQSKPEQRMTQKQLLIYRQWIKEFESQGLDPTSLSIIKLAREKALQNKPPLSTETETPKPFEAKLPWWAKTGLKFGGRNAIRSFAGPKGIVTIGAVVSLYAILCANDVLKHDWCIHKSGVEKLLTEIGLMETTVDGDQKNANEVDSPNVH